MTGLRRCAAVLLLSAPALGACAATVGPAAAQDPAPAPGQALVYVTNQDEATISIFDAGTLEPVDTVDLQALGFSLNARPHHVAVEPDGSHWYVSLIGENRVLKLDRQNRVVGRAEFEVPGMLALDPRSNRLFVGRSMSAVNPPQRIGVIDRGSMSIEEIPVLYPRPHALAVNPAKGVVYSASLGENSIAVVDAEEEAVQLLPVEAPPVSHGGHDVHMLMQFALSPDGSTLVVSGEMSGRLLVFDLSNPREPQLVRQVEVGPRLFDPVFSPDGRWVWVPSKDANTVTAIDATTWTVAGVVEGEGLAEPHGTAFSPDGRYLFVTSNNLEGEYPGGKGTLTVIDPVTREIVRVLQVGANATGVATTPR